MRSLHVVRTLSTGTWVKRRPVVTPRFRFQGLGPRLKGYGLDDVMARYALPRRPVRLLRSMNIASGHQYCITSHDKAMARHDGRMAHLLGDCGVCDGYVSVYLPPRSSIS